MYKDVKFKDSFIVTLHNDLVQADFTDNYTMIEQKVLYTVLSNIEPHDIEPIIYRMRIKDFCDYFNIEKRNYRYFKEVAIALKRKVIGLKNKDTKERNRFISWFGVCEYVDKEGYIEFELSNHIKPYLINLRNNFTKLRLDILLGFKYTYSLRLYQLLNKWSFKGEYTVNTDEFRHLIGIPIKKKVNGKPIFKLEKYNHLKTKAIEPSLKEINNLTDYKVKLVENKKRRKITSITIVINRKKVVRDIKRKKDQQEKEKNEKGYGKEINKTYTYDKTQRMYVNNITNEHVLFHGAERAKAIIFFNEIENMKAEALYKIENLLLKIMKYREYDIPKEMYILCNHTKNADSIRSNEAFIISKLNEVLKGLNENKDVKDVSMERMLNIRSEVLPEWWFDALREEISNENSGESYNEEILKILKRHSS